MANTLYLSPSLDSALDHLVHAVADARHSRPFAPVTLLLPDSASVQAVRRRLGDTMSVRLYQFYGLGQVILDNVGLPVYRLDDLSVRRLVGQRLSRMASEGRLTSFAAVWQTPGFQHVLVEWLREMKSRGITPEAVVVNAAQSGQERDRQLAEFYIQYQNFMHQHGCSDADGLLWLAAETLENTPHLPIDQQLFAALGFDQFNPLQIRILRAFASHCVDFRIYLPWDAQRQLSSLALTRMTVTRQRLEEALSPVILPLESTGAVDPILSHIQRGVFESAPSGPAITIAPDTAVPNTVANIPDIPSTFRLIAAPSREAEVRWALKAIKRLLLDGAAPDQIALLAPNPGVYQRMIEVAAAEYGILVQGEHHLRDNPAVAVLLNLLTLAPEFPWRETMDALRSPYLRLPGLTLEQIDQLDQLSRERPVLGRLDQWRFALTPMLRAGDAQIDDEDLGPARLASQLTPEALAVIEHWLMAFFALLTPPATGTYRSFTLWLQQAILGLFPDQDEEAASTAKTDAVQIPQTTAEVQTETTPAPQSKPLVAAEGEQAASLEAAAGLHSLWMVACSASGPYARRDTQAISKVMQALRALVDAAERVVLTGEESIPWPVYRADLLRVLPGLSLPADPLQPGVRFATLETARSQVVDHLLLLGLAEGEFPRIPAPDVLYAPGERENHTLPLIRIRSGEQASLWWQVLSSCRASLTLLRPRLDEKGAPWLPSSYWESTVEAAKQVMPDLHEIELPIVYQPTLDDAASPAELLLVLAEAGALGVPPALFAPWQASQMAYRLMCQRQSWQPVAGFEGILTDSEALNELDQRYGSRHNWSASRLNRYGSCPYSFFAQTILDLEERTDPAEGFDAMQRGTLLHSVLEKLFQSLTADGITLTPANQPVIEALLEECCTRAFDRAPERYGFQPSAMWSFEQSELRRMLKVFIGWECAQNGETPRFRPYRQELRFGIHGGTLPSLTVECADGSSFRLHGVIDRLDCDAQGKLRLIDYKSGSTLYSRPDIQKGLAFQSALYALAAEQMLPGAAVAESYYLHLPIRKASGKLEFSSAVAENEYVREAVERAALFTQNIRQGRFPALPAKTGFGQNGCAGTCAFSSLCRADRHAFAKARRGGQL